MKLQTRDIKGFLAKPDKDASAILLYGPDAGLARERSRDVIKYLLGPSPDPMSILDVNESRILSDPAMLADELSAVSFLAEKRVILVRDAGDKFTKIMESVESLLSRDNYLIVLGDDLGSRSSLRAWFEKSASAAAVPCYHDEARDIGELVRDTFAKQGIAVSGDVVQYLVSQLGNDRYVTRQELEKLLLYLGDDKTLSMDTVKQLTDHNRETEMDEAICALADKNLAALDKALVGLGKEGLPPVAYLRGLSRYFLRLYAIKLQAQHSSVESVVENLRPKVFYKQKDALIRHARKWDVERIAKALELITAAELACKTSDLPIFAASERELFKAAAIR